MFAPLDTRTIEAIKRDLRKALPHHWRLWLTLTHAMEGELYCRTDGKQAPWQRQKRYFKACDTLAAKARGTIAHAMRLHEWSNRLSTCTYSVACNRLYVELVTRVQRKRESVEGRA